MQNLSKVLVFSDRNASAILLLGGCNLVLIQWIMVRELTALLMGTELVALFVTMSAFIGYSIGYLLSNRLSMRGIRLLALVTLPLHLTLPILYRIVITLLNNTGSYQSGFIVLLALTPFTVSAFYSLFLPRCINTTGSFITLYTIELTGTAVGFMTLLLIGARAMPTFYLPYTLILLMILVLIDIPRPVIAILGIAAVLWVVALPDLDAKSTAYVYRNIYEIEGAQPLASVYSAYQKVDVLRDSQDQLYLYLNGLMDYGSVDLQRFNVMLSGIPAQLLHPAQMAVVGSGSMASVALASPYARQITTVELDPVVADLSQKYFGAINHLDQVHNWTLIIDDAKHFFRNRDVHYDLIAMDVPAPFTLQEAALHSVEYYALLKRHLTANGVVSVSLSSTFTPKRTLALRVVAGLLANFKQVMVITSGSADLSFAYASDQLPFDQVAVEKMLHANDESQFVIYQPSAVQAIVNAVNPISLDDMRLVWELSLNRVRRLLGSSQ